MGNGVGAVWWGTAVTTVRVRTVASTVVPTVASTVEYFQKFPENHEYFQKFINISRNSSKLRIEKCQKVHTVDQHTGPNSSCPKVALFPDFNTRISDIILGFQTKPIKTVKIPTLCKRYLNPFSCLKLVIFTTFPCFLDWFNRGFNVVFRVGVFTVLFGNSVSKPRLNQA